MFDKLLATVVGVMFMVGGGLWAFGVWDGTRLLPWVMFWVGFHLIDRGSSGRLRK